MTWDAEHYAAAWNTRVASHPVTLTPVVDHETGNMSDNDLIERVAQTIWHCGFHPDDVASGEADRRKADWPDDWHKAVNKAQAAIAIIEQDRAALVAEIVAWLRKEAIMSTDTVRRRMNKALDQIEAKWGKV